MTEKTLLMVDTDMIRKYQWKGAELSGACAIVIPATHALSLCQQLQ